jgi:hypothetical protein
MASMSDTSVRDITGEDWGRGWFIEYGGESGLLGSIDAFGTSTPGLYHLPDEAPANPNPALALIRYCFGPGNDDDIDCCSTTVSVVPGP